MSSRDVLDVLLLLVSLAGLLLFYRSRKSQFPPGPRAMPFIGNALDFSPSSAWVTFTKWKKTYGPLLGLRVLGTNILVLNSKNAMNDLLDKRGGIYSDRPVFTVAGELMGADRSMVLKSYGPDWRACRKLEHIALSPAASKQYQPMQEKYAAMLVSEILDSPDDFYDLVRLCSSRIVLSLTYGISAQIGDAEYIAHAEATMNIISSSTVPGAFWCDFLPILKYLPSWVPFKRKAAEGRRMLEALVNKPYERVKADMANAQAAPSLTRDLLSATGKDELTAEVEERIKWTTGSMYGAGGETTAGTTLAFIIAMALHPDVCSKAQAEIDAVVGSDRLPKVTDRAALPYVDALVKEVMRWYPMLPLSVARRTAKDDVYEGYFIPKGTVVMPNVWQLAFEPNAKYPPEQFIPERFLDAEHPTRDPAAWAFGFGRRICPGKAVGEASVFILIATLLATVDIAPPPPSDGPIRRECDSCLVRVPNRFKCTITPRTDPKVDLARQAAQA